MSCQLAFSGSMWFSVSIFAVARLRESTALKYDWSCVFYLKARLGNFGKNEKEKISLSSLSSSLLQMESEIHQK